MDGRSTTDVVFFIRQLKELFAEKKKPLHLIFIVLEKAFDFVPSELIPWALRQQSSRKSGTNNNVPVNRVKNQSSPAPRMQRLLRN